MAPEDPTRAPVIIKRLFESVNPIPAAAQPEEGPAAPRRVPRDPARGNAGGLRVPSRFVARRRRGGPPAARGGHARTRSRSARETVG